VRIAREPGPRTTLLVEVEPGPAPQVSEAVIDFEGDIATSPDADAARSARASAPSGRCEPASPSPRPAGTAPRPTPPASCWPAAIRPGGSATAWPTSMRRRPRRSWACGWIRGRCSTWAKLRVTGMERYDPQLVPRSPG
jgi:hypothetical protein